MLAAAKKTFVLAQSSASFGDGVRGIREWLDATHAGEHPFGVIGAGLLDCRPRVRNQSAAQISTAHASSRRSLNEAP
jgi:hypothetical protein